MKENILTGCKKNNKKAQEELYRLYAPKVMGVCRRYAGSLEDARDIFQEAFINIYNSLKKDRAIEIESLDAWVRRISANTAVTYYHKHKKYRDQVSTDAVLQQGDGDNYGHILSRLRSKELLQLIDELPVGCRLVFNLYVIEGYGHKEIAGIMGVSEGTSKSQLSRARDIMKSKLKMLDHVKYRNVV